MLINKKYENVYVTIWKRTARADIGKDNNMTKLSEIITSNKKALLAALDKSNWMVIDNHTKGREVKIIAIGRLRNNSIFGIIENAKYQSLNEIYINHANGKVHLSTYSVGGVLWDLGYEKYNHHQSESLICNPIIEIITEDGETQTFSSNKDVLKECI